MTAPQITIVSPLFRSGEFVRDLIERIDQTLSARADSWSLLLVDDACPSRSGEMAARLGHPNVDVIRLEANVGQHAATSIGVLQVKGSIIVVMDSDLQDRPEDIPLLLDRVEEDIVIAAGRRGSYSGPVERVTGAIFRVVRWILSRGKIPPDAGMFLCCEADVLQSVASFGDPSVHLLSRAALSGVSIVSVPIERERRNGGSHSPGQRLAMGLRGLQALIANPDSKGFSWPEIELLTPTRHEPTPSQRGTET